MNKSGAMEVDADNEHDVLCEKIISDIHAVFLKDTELSTFEIIPTILNRNKSPVVHVEHNLGLESWCAKHVYEHAHKLLLTHKRHQQHHHQRNTLQQSDVLVKYLNVTLLINPDVTSFWNMRRQLVQINRLKINREFQFSALILSKKSKSAEAFAYRRWLFSFQSAESIDWPAEINICERCADRSPSNYHAWLHREWVLQNAPFLMKSELLMSEKFMRKHISDYSSYHYRQTLLARAYAMCYYEHEELTQLNYLKKLINYYLIADVRNSEDVIQALLPKVDRIKLGEQRFKSYLFCCNVAAFDMRLCDEQKHLYGPRESFEHHRRASLRFIVEQTVRLLLGESAYTFHLPPSGVQSAKFNEQLLTFDYSSNNFLGALKRYEGMLGDEHRSWCNIFLGFGFNTTQDE